MGVQLCRFKNAVIERTDFLPSACSMSFFVVIVLLLSMIIVYHISALNARGCNRDIYFRIVWGHKRGGGVRPLFPITPLVVPLLCPQALYGAFRHLLKGYAHQNSDYSSMGIHTPPLAP